MGRSATKVSGLEIRLKRIYDESEPQDGARILVDRLWPRGVSKKAAAVDLWVKEIAPSDDLRQWFGHEPERWEEFRERYFEELDEKDGPLEKVVEKVRQGRVTLLYAARDQERNNAVALKRYLEAHMSD